MDRDGQNYDVAIMWIWRCALQIWLTKHESNFVWMPFLLSLVTYGKDSRNWTDVHVESLPLMWFGRVKHFTTLVNFVCEISKLHYIKSPVFDVDRNVCCEFLMPLAMQLRPQRWCAAQYNMLGIYYFKVSLLSFIKMRWLTFVCLLKHSCGAYWSLHSIN